MYVTNNATLLHQYQSDSVMTASPMDLIVMLYEALIKQLKFSDIFIEDKEYEKANQHLLKAEDIVSELLRSLDFNYPIADELMKLYDFILQELTNINTHKDRSRIPDLMEIIVSLKDAWVAVRNSQNHHAFTIEE